MSIQGKKFRRLISIFLTFMMILFIYNLPVKKANAADEYDGLRAKWKEMVNGGTAFNPLDPDFSSIISRITATAQLNWDTMNKSPGRTYLWSDLASSTDYSHITNSYRRLKALALAYATQGSSLQNNATLKADIISALDWLYTNWYNETKAESGNWWFWEIGTPLALNDCTVLLYDILTTTQITNYMNAVDHFQPTVTMSGANRVWECTIIAVRGVIIKNSAKITAARNGLSAVFLYVTSGDGFYTDGSFIQHTGHPYTGGYGQDLIQDITNVMYLLNGSTWQVTDTNKDNVYKWIYDSYEPLIHKGAMADMTEGRVISRYNFENHVIGHYIIRAVIRLTQFAPSADVAKYKSMVKEWIQKDTYLSFYSDATLNTAILGKAIVNDGSVTARGDIVKNKQYPEMARTMHLRPGFNFGISMNSSRIYNYESINSENLRGWHTSDGMTYIYNNDLSQYSDNFWPTVNSYRLPGTTVEQNTTIGASKYSTQTWVGGTQFLGTYGVTGMALHPYLQTLEGRKSWFMFDDEIVALGAGITATDNKVVETIVENRKLNSSGNNALTVNGTVKPTNLGWSETMTGVNWMHLAGNVSGSDIGYYFPSAATVKGLREARTDAWNSINTNNEWNNPTLYTRNYLTLWFDHGSNPANATYSYILLPNKTNTGVNSYAASPQVSILENSTEAQAVKEIGLNITGINFWKIMVKRVGIVQVDKQASVMLKENTDSYEIAVSDPTQLNTGTLTLEIQKSGADILSADPAITVTQLSPIIRFTVDLTNLNGRSVYAKFARPETFMEAEGYSSKSANIYVGTCSDYGGGSDIEGAYNGDWVTYNNVDFGIGVQNIDLRLASVRTGGTIELRLDSTTGMLIGTASVPNTGGWQTWTNTAVAVTGATGIHTLYLVFKRSDGLGVVNVNWIKFSKPVLKQIEAENYSGKSANIYVGTCSDTGGGSDIEGAYNNDWVTYNTAYFASGVSTISLRLASVRTGGTIELRLDSTTGTLIGTATVPNTGGWQIWTTVNVPVSGATGVHRLYLVFKRSDSLGVGNVNWFQYTKK